MSRLRYCGQRLEARKAAKAAPAEAAVKEPWQMTEEEFTASAKRGKIAPFGTEPAVEIQAVLDGKKLVSEIYRTEFDFDPEPIRKFMRNKDMNYYEEEGGNIFLYRKTEKRSTSSN